jgi:uncharacterized protein (TIGR02147 family)
MEVPFYRQFLMSELARRCSKNSRYSIRAFAQALDIDPGTTSRLISGKQVPGLKMSEKILESLDPSPEEREQFLSSLAVKKTSDGHQRLNSFFKSFGKRPAHVKPKELSIELYRVISDWYHAVILELPYTEGFQSDPRWIAQELGISITEAQLAIARLTELGFLKKKNGKLVNDQGQLTSANKTITTAAHRKNQKQFLEKAIYSLENDPIERRNMTRITMAIDPEKIPIAKEMIFKFSRRLCRFLESGKRKEVYSMSVALFPNQRKKESSK